MHICVHLALFSTEWQFQCLQIFQDNCCKRELLNLEIYCTNAPDCTQRVTLCDLQVTNKTWPNMLEVTCPYPSSGITAHYLSFSGSSKSMPVWADSMFKCRVQRHCVTQKPNGPSEERLLLPPGVLPSLPTVVPRVSAAGQDASLSQYCIQYSHLSSACFWSRLWTMTGPSEDLMPGNRNPVSQQVSSDDQKTQGVAQSDTSWICI